MKIGFTGTRQGMSTQQSIKIKDWLKSKYVISELHHGDCVGADEDMCNLVAQHGSKDTVIVCHPPVVNHHRAYTSFDYTREPKKYLNRNHDIVSESDIIIATPRENKEELRSGTWATIRYAIKMNKIVAIIYPDGSIEMKDFASKIK